MSTMARRSVLICSDSIERIERRIQTFAADPKVLTRLGLPNETNIWGHMDQWVLDDLLRALRDETSLEKSKEI